MEMLDDATDAYILKNIANATDIKEPLELPANATLDKFIANGWIRHAGEGADRYFITEAGRQALIAWRNDNNR